jgi:hypothetical protein
VLPLDGSAIRDRAENSVLQSLRYDKMTHRYEDIVEAYPQTFKCIFETPTEQQQPWSSFVAWLNTDQGVYWIGGKAGSGKSTLMKHVLDDSRTAQLLEDWAQNILLCQASYFFWNSRSREQKSEVGCLKVLLFQIFDRYPQLVPIVLPERWANSYSNLIHRSAPSQSP